MELNKIGIASSSTDNNLQDSHHINMVNLPILAEGPQVSQDLNMTNLRILEEGPQICPLCSQEIKLYFINYDERVEMCENLECEYPFGHKPLKILREDNGVQIVEVKSVIGKGTRSSTCSQASNSAWSDVDNLSNINDTAVVANDLNKFKTAAELKETESERRKAELFQNVEKIKQMTNSMSALKRESKSTIRNEKWIKNLEYLQGLSGVSLLKPEEMRKIKKLNGPKLGELKIDIDKGNLTNIRIEVNRV